MGVKGIDVSSYHGKIDWDKVKADGIEFALIRAGWSKDYVDPMFRKNIDGAKEAGVKIGVYWYIYAKNENDVLENAKKFHEMIYPYSRLLDMGAWGVWGNDSETYCKKKLSRKDRSNFIITFCNTMNEYGYKCGYYSDTEFYPSKLNITSLKYPIWFSNFATSNEVCDALIWQYDLRGRVDGIVPKVNFNICNGDIKEYIYKPVPTIKNTQVPKYPKLEKGSTSQFVSLLQSLLAEHGYEIELTGAFDPKTYNAVKKLQADNNLEVTGVVGNETWAILIEE